MESAKYNTTVIITGAIRGSSRERYYKEVGLESLQQSRCIGNSVTFFKSYKISFQATYLMKSLPVIDLAIKEIPVPQFNVRHGFLNNFLFLSTAFEWNLVNWNMKKSETVTI